MSSVAGPQSWSVECRGGGGPLQSGAACAEVAWGGVGCCAVPGDQNSVILFPESGVKDLEAKLTKISLKDGAAIMQVRWVQSASGSHFVAVASMAGLQVGGVGCSLPSTLLRAGPVCVPHVFSCCMRWRAASGCRRYAVILVC
jgi:hypothetical protein